MYELVQLGKEVSSIGMRLTHQVTMAFHQGSNPCHDSSNEPKEELVKSLLTQLLCKTSSTGQTMLQCPSKKHTRVKKPICHEKDSSYTINYLSYDTNILNLKLFTIKVSNQVRLLKSCFFVFFVFFEELLYIELSQKRSWVYLGMNSSQISFTYMDVTTTISHHM